MTIFLLSVEINCVEGTELQILSNGRAEVFLGENNFFQITDDTAWAGE